MTSIEENWQDVTVYYVEFTSLGRNQTISTHRKTLIFNNSIIVEDVYDLVKARFSNILDVTEVDELADGLLLKQ